MASIERANELVKVIDAMWNDYGRGEYLDADSLAALNSYASDESKHHLLGMWLKIDLIAVCLQQKLRRDQDALFDKLYWDLVSSGFWKEFHLKATREEYNTLQEQLKLRGNWKNTVKRMVGNEDEGSRVASVIDYSFTDDDIKELALIYKGATSDDVKEAIEYLLTSCNFHSVVADFSKGVFLKYIRKEAEL